MALTPLPIDPHLPAILDAFRTAGRLVLAAEPGAGKTTRVPRALLDAGLLEAGACWVLEPHRLAARLAAARVAAELGEPLGGRVGYAVRFEQKTSPATRICFVTEGLLLRRLQADPRLEGISTVLLDEFHERHLQTDLALALLARLRRTRPDLRLGVMSATLDAGPVAAYLGAGVLRCPGRPYPVDVQHLARPDDRPMAVQVAEAVDRLRRDGRCGHTLVFLPGAAEIRQALKTCEPVAARHGLRLLPLHGSLGFDAQQAAVAPCAEPKVILSTNVAESSVTLEGVDTVIDSGLGREAVHSPWTGLPGLRTARISQARCVQRAGRAGRTGPGLCLRLFTQADFQARPDFDPPELLRADLAETLLALADLGAAGPGTTGQEAGEGLDWLQPPPPAALEAAAKLLRSLGALAPDGRITPMGKRMARLPLHPRLARLVVAGDDLGIPRLARQAAALLEVGDLEARAGLERRPDGGRHALDSDLFQRLDQYREAEAAHFHGGACRAAGLDPAAVRQASLACRALAPGRSREAEPADAEDRLLRALLPAYPDRVARVGAGGTCALVGGGGARLDPACRVRRAEWILALEAEVESQGAGTQVRVRTASRIAPDWLLDAFPEALRETGSVAWNPSAGRVELRSAIWYEDLCLDQSRRAAPPDHPEAAACLAGAALAAGLGAAQETVDRLLERSAFLAAQRPDLGIPAGEDLRTALVTDACRGRSTLKELAGADWPGHLRTVLGGAAAGLLASWAPDTLDLPGKRRVRVNYGGETPWIASRLQDFLGLKEGPRVAGGQVPLVLHLLAPNNRDLQVTTDLKGFWQRAYQELRPGLSRRYPKHRWPERPA
jgi:ATP-dependent helicase HrpB